jgi:hypothetical protein
MLFGFHITSCSKAIEENNAAPANFDAAQAAENRSVRTVTTQSAETVESKSSPNPKDVVLFNGMNYIKKSGWKTPSRNDVDIDQNYDQDKVERVTVSGKQIRTKTIFYYFRTPWLHSQDFYYEGRELDYLKGKLESGAFLEMRANDKVFLYSIFVEKVVSPPSNSESHQDPFGYKIMDDDGDGIFETLIYHDGDIVVPDWVLK